MNARHMEFFEPDLGRGPFSSQRIETTAVQIAAALAQVRAPLSRSDDDLRAHADFIRELSDRIVPDWAAALTITVDPVYGDTVHSTILAPTGAYSLLHCWLSDSNGGGLTQTTPNLIFFNIGTVIQTIENNRHFLVLTSASGIVDITVSYYGAKSWYWAVSRYGRVYYSPRLYFPSLDLLAGAGGGSPAGGTSPGGGAAQSAAGSTQATAG